MKACKPFLVKQITLLAVLFFFSFQNIQAQVDADKTEQKSEFWSKVRFGGGVGLSFGNGFFSGTLAPQAIYQINQTVGLGVGLTGTFNNRKNRYKSTILGGSLISTFNVAQGLQLSGEFEQLNVNRKFDSAFSTNADTNYWYSALFVGAGYRMGPVSVGIRYDLLYNKEKSIYAEPWMPFMRVMF